MPGRSFLSGSGGVGHRLQVAFHLAHRLQAEGVDQNLQDGRRQEGGQARPDADVLDAERELFSVQLELEGSRADRLNSIVDLYTALGSGWAWRADNDLEKRDLQKPWVNKEKFSE